ncbi:carbohydrate esterase family 8 protein [Mycena floridula]|nr:carbohydrate esterase family 8 protein [Mycena floridula]
MKTLILCLVALLAVTFAKPAPENRRTTPPPGSLVVRAGTKATNEFSTIIDAVNALPNDSSTQSIFVFPGLYLGQVSITRPGPLAIYGYTNDIFDYQQNEVTISSGINATSVGSNDLSASLRVEKDNFRLYNLNVKNTYGPGVQALALAQNGNHVGLYACAFFGYQDTLFPNNGIQVYLRGYIEGAVDFIFGGKNSTPRAYFLRNTIGVVGPGYITANGRIMDDVGIYLFEHTKIVLAPNAVNTTAGNVYLGRPWRDYAKVVFKDTVITAPLNPAVWSVWNSSTPLTDHILFGEFHTTGPGVANAVRPDFATVLTVTEAAQYNISLVLGDDYASWVDVRYL